MRQVVPVLFRDNVVKSMGTDITPGFIGFNEDRGSTSCACILVYVDMNVYAKSGSVTITCPAKGFTIAVYPVKRASGFGVGGRRGGSRDRGVCWRSGGCSRTGN